MGDSGAFWGTIVQVVPVMFIAAMIEFRYLFGRFSRSEEHFVASRGLRVVLGLMLLTVTGLLVWTFLTAIRALRVGALTDAPEASVSLYALGAAAGVSLASPGVVLFISATADVWSALWRRFPWSVTSRRGRRKRALDEEKRRLLQTARELRSEILRDTARYFIRASSAERDAKHLPEARRLAVMPIVAEIYELADESLAALKEFGQVVTDVVKLQSSESATVEDVARFRKMLAAEASRISS